MRFMNKKKDITCTYSAALTESLSFIESSLRELGVNQKLALRTVLLAEELLPQFIQYSDPGARLRIQVQKLLGDASVTIHAPGRQFDPLGSPAEGAGAFGQMEMEDEEAQQAIRSILLKSQGDRLKLTHKGGTNHARILVGQSNQSMLVWTVAALIAGLLFGVLMKFAFPAALDHGLSTYLLNPAKTMFMNALKIIIGPVVFFSIVSCISQFKDLAELGRIAAKVMGLYLTTTVIAVLLALGLSLLLHPGQFGFALSLDADAEAIRVNTDVDTSLLHTIINIVPANFVRPFLEADTLQIIFLGLLCGVAVGMIGKYAPILQDFFEACNSLFLTVTTIISRFIPLAVFCSSAMMMADMGGSSLLNVLGYAGTELLAIACMMAIYGLLILVLGHLNPLTFFRKNREGMLTSFTLSSSSAALPTNMRTCTDKLGISPKVCSFSIPLGATVNMDGTSILLTVGGLFLARAYGVTVPGSALVSLSITIILLSLGCPGVPGSGFVCLGLVLEGLGVPIEALGLVMGISPIIEMFATMSNTTGDVAASLIVARSEGLLDLKKYKS